MNTENLGHTSNAQKLNGSSQDNRREQGRREEQHERDAIRILLVDDHTVLRAGTRRILEDEPDLRVIGEAGDGEEALQLAETLRPDLVVLDIAMPHLDGVKTCQVLRKNWPEMHILILTGLDNETLIRTLDRQGIDGYLLKSARPAELIHTIRSIMEGERVYGERVSQVLSLPVHEDLQPTRKELEVLSAIARGLRNRDIANELHLSVNTVEYHIRNLFLKLEATSRADALMRAQRLGWLDSQEPLC